MSGLLELQIYFERLSPTMSESLRPYGMAVVVGQAFKEPELKLTPF